MLSQRRHISHVSPACWWAATLRQLAWRYVQSHRLLSINTVAQLEVIIHRLCVIERYICDKMWSRTGTMAYSQWHKAIELCLSKVISGMRLPKLDMEARSRRGTDTCCQPISYTCDATSLWLWRRVTTWQTIDKRRSVGGIIGGAFRAQLYSPQFNKMSMDSGL